METQTTPRYLSIDVAEFSDAFGSRPVGVRHTIRDHPLLTLDALGTLAENLPESSFEHNVGNVPEIVPGGEGVERADLPPGEIVRTIETNGQWAVIKFIEKDPQYKRLLDETLDEVEPLVDAREGGMIQREGFVFLSSPGSMTPSHTDPEHNILLQIRGSKDMTVGKFPDERTRQLEIEDAVSGGHRNIEWKPIEPEVFHLEPGDAVYVPPHAPHLVKNGDTVSVSLSITWRTPAVERMARVSSVNGRLRRLGLNPRPPGRSELRDRLKFSVSKALGRRGAKG